MADKVKKAASSDPVPTGLKIEHQGVERDVAVIANPTGMDFLKVGRLMNGNAEEYYPSALHVLFRVSDPSNAEKPWRQLAPHQWTRELSWKDFSESMAKLIELGFQLGA